MLLQKLLQNVPDVMFPWLSRRADLMSLEDELGIEIELDEKVETVDDLDKFIQSKQG